MVIFNVPKLRCQKKVADLDSLVLSVEGTESTAEGRAKGNVSNQDLLSVMHLILVLKLNPNKEFPGGLVVTIPDFHCHRPKCNPWSGS